jgi:hypothetical protein
MEQKIHAQNGLLNNRNPLRKDGVKEVEKDPLSTKGKN